MARVTVEDCIQIVPSRFELVSLAAKRARDIGAGSPPTVDRDNDKNAVIALREIAVESISVDDVRESIVRGMQHHIPTSDDSDAELDSELRAELEAGEGSDIDQVTTEQMTTHEAEEQLNIVDEDTSDNSKD